MIPTVQGLLQVTPIHEEDRYIRVRIRDVEIANNTDIILHMINPNEINQIVQQLEQNIKELNLKNREILETEIRTIKSKLKTIQNPSRQKRGLINLGGTINKWLFGTMDDNDRQEILEHLQVVDENSHNSIQNLNKQIKINESFNKTLLNLKELIEDDRKKILQSINETNFHIKNLSETISFLDQETKLRYIENKINQILDNIVAAKNNFIHPSMLTTEELDLYKVDIHKLKLLKVGVLEYQNKFLVFAIKIPRDYILTELQLIKPVPNKQNFEIDEKDELIVEINNNTYNYNESSNLKDLKLSNHCMTKKKCTLKYNNVTSIEEIDDETILLKNMYNDSLIQNCDKRKYQLKGNFLINFNNCTLEIKRQKFYNKKITILDKYYYPVENIQIITQKTIDFNKIIIENEKNIEEIKELKFHRNIMYGTNISVTFLVAISILIVISYICWKNKKDKIKIINNMKPEASDSKRGGATYIEFPMVSGPTVLPDAYRIPTKPKPMAW